LVVVGVDGRRVLKLPATMPEDMSGKLVLLTQLTTPNRPGGPEIGQGEVDEGCKIVMLKPMRMPVLVSATSGPFEIGDEMSRPRWDNCTVWMYSKKGVFVLARS
jgi:hypothetical protein